MGIIYKGVSIRWSNVHQEYLFNITGCWVITTPTIKEAKEIIDRFID